MKVKSTFPASNAQASRLWRIADAICQGPALQLLPVCANLSPNRPVIRWISVEQDLPQLGRSSGGYRLISQKGTLGMAIIRQYQSSPRYIAALHLRAMVVLSALLMALSSTSARADAPSWFFPGSKTQIALPFPEVPLADISSEDAPTLSAKTCRKIDHVGFLFSSKKGYDIFDARRTILVEVPPALNLEDHGIVNSLVYAGLYYAWTNCFARAPQGIALIPIFAGVTVEIQRDGKLALVAGPSTTGQARISMSVAQAAEAPSPSSETSNASKDQVSPEIRMSEGIANEFVNNEFAAIKKYSDYQQIVIQAWKTSYKDGKIAISYYVLPDAEKKGSAFLVAVKARDRSVQVLVECHFSPDSAPDPASSSTGTIHVLAKLVEYSDRKITLDCQKQ